jgi:predicted ATPase/DNA-binding CsgD family transcriptional regulator
MSVTAIAALERGRSASPRPSTVVLLADALGLSVAERALLVTSAHQPRQSDADRAAPQPLTSFIGRDRELAALTDLVWGKSSSARLVTLTGPPGTGKTRLALRLTAEPENQADGVWFVPLASIRDPTLIAHAVAQALGMRDASSERVVERVIAFLRLRSALLVLDNFEHVLAGAPLIGRLLEHCPQLKVVVTSRAPLRLYGEHEFLVPPLSAPDAATGLPVERLMQSDAVRLFVERAEAVRFDFQLTDATGPAVAEICRRLDGLPLAIELAAARSKTLSPQALVARLGDRLSLLTTGPQDRPTRQRTLRAALDWSYDLLSSAERTLLRRLAIFVGGCTLDAATAVCNANGDLEFDVLEGLTSLVDQSLLQLEAEPDGEPRFRMLESIREYAWERLVGSADLGLVRQRHAHAFLALAEAAEAQLQGLQQTVWRDRLQREMPNLRVALRWSLDTGQTEQALRAAAALWLFWFVRGLGSEGRRWLAQLLEHPSAAAVGAARARALFTAGMLAFYQRDYAAGSALHEAGLTLQRRLGDPSGIASALFGLGQVSFDGGDLARARALHEEALAIRRKLGDLSQIAFSVGNMGLVVYEQGDTLLARELIEESIAIRRQLGDGRATAGMLFTLARVSLDTGDIAQARALYRESVAIGRQVDDRWALGHVLAGLAGLAGAEGRWRLALRLQGAATMASEVSESSLFPGWRERVDRQLEHARDVLGPVGAAAAWAQGRAEDVDALLIEVLDADSVGHQEEVVDVPTAAQLGTHASSGMPLTRREREVAALIARGYTNREIAASLVITERTAATHVEHMLAKLQMTSRAQIAAWATERLVAPDE